MEVLSNRTKLRERGDRWCQIKVELRKTDKGLELSVTGGYGEIVSEASARKRALQNWESFFNDDKNAIHEMNRRCGFQCRTALGAAKKVIASDGKFHGLDVFCQDGDRVFLLEGCGCIHDELLDWFPEAKDLIPFHLNGMNAGCVHQRKLGWKHGKTIALSPDDLTEAQHKSLDALEAQRLKPLIASAIDKRKKEILASKSEQVNLYKRAKQTDFCSVSDAETVYRSLTTTDQTMFFAERNLRKDLLAFIEKEVAQKIKPEPFAGALYKDCIGAPCPVCGYRYGSQWIYDELPEAIVAQAKSVTDWSC